MIQGRLIETGLRAAESRFQPLAPVLYIAGRLISSDNGTLLDIQKMTGPTRGYKPREFPLVAIEAHFDESNSPGPHVSAHTYVRVPNGGAVPYQSFCVFPDRLG